MSFEIGQTVVYPHHGAATIEEVMTRTIRGEERTYLKLRVNQGDLEIQVPAENVDMVGVRDIVDEDGLEEVLSVLRAPYIEEPTNWSRRFKANQEKIATGDIVKVAEVVRDLTRRDDLKKLSTGEKRMLTKARQILSSETCNLLVISIRRCGCVASMRSWLRATMSPSQSRMTSQKKTRNKSDFNIPGSGFRGHYCGRIGYALGLRSPESFG